MLDLIKKNLNIRSGILLLSLTIFFVFITNPLRKNKSKDISNFIVQVEKGILSDSINTSGEVKAIRTSNIGPRKQGVIKEIKVEEGDIVKKDQVLASLDDEDFIYKIEEGLEKGLSVRSMALGEEENLIIKQLGFLTAKPIIYATNLNENDLAEGNDFSSKVQSFASNENTECIKISAQVESELIELEPEDKKDYLMGLGVEEGGLSSLIRSTYKLLGLKTYFTTGEKETKAWTIKDGMTAPQAAGVIHTDFEKGFIRAQTISYQNLIDSGSIANAKTKGLLRSEGKEYIVNEGDVMEFLFNV